MSFFHVLVSSANKPDEFRCFVHDLSKRELKSIILRPYIGGKSLVAEGQILPASELRGIKIIETDVPAKTALAAATDELNNELEHTNADQSSEIVLMPCLGYGLDQIAEIGTDVTRSHINEAPGEGGRVKAFNIFISHPWISGIGTAIIAALILASLNL